MELNSPVAIIFANIKGNIGDFAILHAMLVDLRRLHPERPLHVFPHSCHNIDQLKFNAFRAADVPNFTLCSPIFSRELPFPLKLLSYAGLWPLARMIFVRMLDRESSCNVERFTDYYAIFVAGGHQWSGFKGLSMFATLRAIHRYNKSLYAYPFSVNGSVRSLSAVSDLKKNFNLLCAPLVARDSTSQSVLESCSQQTVLGTDCVLELFNDSKNIPARKDVNSSRVLLVMAGDRRLLEKQLRRLVKELRNNFPRLALLTTCEIAEGALFRKLSAEMGLEYCAPVTWQEAVSEMKSSALVISNRLHGLILASFAGIPILPVANREKVTSFVKDVSFPFVVPSLDKISSEFLKEVFRGKVAILEKISSFQEKSSGIPHGPITAYNEVSSEISAGDLLPQRQYAMNRQELMGPPVESASYFRIPTRLPVVHTSDSWASAITHSLRATSQIIRRVFSAIFATRTASS